MDQPTINSSHPDQGEDSAFEVPSNISPPEPMGPGQINQSNPNQNKPAEAPPSDGNLKMPPGRPILSYILILVLILILIAGSLVFAAWKGWIKIDGLFGGGKSTPTPTTSASSVISPAISPIVSPQASSSAEITSNINDETRKKDLANIKSALKKYYNDHSEYPKTTGVIKTSDKSTAFFQALYPQYITSLIDDPLSPQYYYGYQSDGQTFELTAVLEDKSDPSGVLTGPYNLYKLTNSSVE